MMQPLRSFCNFQVDETQNLEHFLFDREGGYNRRNSIGKISSWHSLYERQFYRSITPNLTVQNIDITGPNGPLGYMRKFTPDGKLLLVFTINQHSIDLYAFNGIGHAADLLHGYCGDCITAVDQSVSSLQIRQQLFNRLFTLRHNITLTTVDYSRNRLNREFSIFLDKGRYVLLAAIGITRFKPISLIDYPDVWDDCEFLAYTFYVVDMENGVITDSIKYEYDSILLSHNNGVAIYGSRIAILSKYKQCIYLLEFVNGKLNFLNTVGGFGSVDHKNMFYQVPEFAIKTPRMLSMNNLPFSFLKQRILAHLYININNIQCDTIRKEELKKFHKNFKNYEKMILIKIQYIDSDHLLLRYEVISEYSETQSEENATFKLYVFYSLNKKQVIKVFQNDSVELIYLIRDFCDQFRNSYSVHSGRPSSSPSNNEYYRAEFNSIIAAVPGGETIAAARYNQTLPVSSQSFSVSPYLDYNLFDYDDRIISAMERPKVSGVDPIIFTDRITKQIKFRLYLELPSNMGSTMPEIRGLFDLNPDNRDLVVFIFHPYEPLIISVQKISMRYIINIHLYNSTTIVNQ